MDTKASASAADSRAFTALNRKALQISSTIERVHISLSLVLLHCGPARDAPLPALLHPQLGHLLGPGLQLTVADHLHTAVETIK